MDFLTERRQVVLGVSGSIAAYKSAEIARIFISRGYEVRVVMSTSAKEFITPVTLSAITGEQVLTGLFDGSETDNIGHIELADWADVMVIAPASADCIAKLAHGFTDDALLAVALATKSPIIVCPAMNVNMYENPQTQSNLKSLEDRGIIIVDPEEGELACGWNGSGRLASGWEIFHITRRALSDRDYQGKKVLISTGPTREAIDPVRFISNRSSGKMGIWLAREAFRRGADVTLIHGPINPKVPTDVKCIPVTTAIEMAEAVEQASSQDAEKAPDFIIMAAAVADFRPKEFIDSKIKKIDGSPTIELVPNPDILTSLGEKKSGHNPVIVGFAVETGDIETLIGEIRLKLERKKADLIVGNLAEDALDLDTNRVWLIDRTGKQEQVATTFKSRIANKILDSALKLS